MKSFSGALFAHFDFPAPTRTHVFLCVRATEFFLNFFVTTTRNKNGKEGFHTSRREIRDWGSSSASPTTKRGFTKRARSIHLQPAAPGGAAAGDEALLLESHVGHGRETAKAGLSPVKHPGACDGSTNVCVYIYIYVYTYIHILYNDVYMCIYIYIWRVACWDILAVGPPWQESFLRKSQGIT